MSLPRESDSSWDNTATVRIVTTMHVTIKGSGPHPDCVDWEAAAEALDKRIEEHGSVPPDIEVSYCTMTSETEPW